MQGSLKLQPSGRHSSSSLKESSFPSPFLFFQSFFSFEKDNDNNCRLFFPFTLLWRGQWQLPLFFSSHCLRRRKRWDCCHHFFFLCCKEDDGNCRHFFFPLFCCEEEDNSYCHLLLFIIWEEENNNSNVVVFLFLGLLWKGRR